MRGLVTYSADSNGQKRLGYAKDTFVIDLAEAYSLKEITEGARIGDAVERSRALFGGDLIDVLDHFSETSRRIKETVAFAEQNLVSHKFGNVISNLNDVKIWTPFSRTRKVIVTGNAYRNDGETPMVMFKPPTSIIGPDDTIILPKNRSSTGTFWEIELAFVIGKKCKYVEPKDAQKYIAGYTIYNDVTDYGRGNLVYKEENGKKLAGRITAVQESKAFDTFCVIGPSVALSDEIKDPHSLALKVWQNSRLVFEGNTDKMVKDEGYFLSFFSDNFTLEPGDIITMGAPTKGELHAGDILEFEIEGIGRIKNYVEEEK